MLDGPGRPSIRAPRAAGGGEEEGGWDDVDPDTDWSETGGAGTGGAETGWTDSGDDPDPDGDWDGGTQAYRAYDDDADYHDDPDDIVRTPAPPPVHRRRGGGRPPGPPRPPPRAPRAILLKQRRRRRRFIIGLTFFLSATVSLVGSSYVYLQYRIGQISRLEVPSLVGDHRGQVMNVLLVGSDSRARLEGKDALQAGKGSVSGQRSDTIMVLHIDPKEKQAAILSIPRDLYVPIAGEDYSDRVNAAFSLGGAPALAETIQESLGITINHYVEVDFVGFKDIVDAVGGVDLYLPYWVRDFTSGLDLPRTGCVSVDGTQGLAWVRSRNFEYMLEDGLTWVPDPRADLGRIERQQDFIRRMLKKALSSGLTNPLQLNRLIGIGVRDVKLDDTLSTKDITALARRFDNLDADSVSLLTLPTTPDDVDGASVLRLREDEAQPYLDRINGIHGGGTSAPRTATTTSTLSPGDLLFPGDVDLRVLNGEGTPGAAGRAATALQTAGFVVAGTGDSTEVARTVIRHGPDALAPAEMLQAALVNGADLVVDRTVTATDLVLVIGADYQGLKDADVAPVPRPSTTVTTSGTTGSTSPTSASTTSIPPTTLGPTTLPPGQEC